MAIVYKHILSAVDGSKEAERAFETAIDVALRNDGKLYIGHVIDTRTFATVEAYDRTITERAETYAKELLDDYVNRARERGVKEVETVIEYGSPKVTIAKKIAPNNEIDLIICGATGLNAVERFFIGSVSESIVRYAKCDVLIVRQ
ncbi:MAG: universal stress protein [Exiguobacterium sp.]|mgnify:CR=1 FL=1|uniref:Universal stress protein n=1 Tax=Exiguobacterium alkaliphilum TaxID=1428684 RepID=A0ABT2KSU2_9BACL|nr:MULTISPECIES: universal stress protein [Exiguobacterium]MDX5324450.1 universal stress protein [Exiguobacterium sp.]MCT4794058.1 universal stress protein [Exiguobacterium alkaliphilum]MDX5426294.1 universal stress protein [Exiguobacterium sp.]MDX6773667.1 universal stress protein [Exiguobacterium sp.]QUE87628.1 universal stress protein [Exiguobacterium alkaliphilum]